MTPEQFAYWLQGYCEMVGEEPTTQQWEMIKDHLKTVFVKVTPARPDPLERLGALPSIGHGVTLTC